MIKSVTSRCGVCGHSSKENYPIPKHRSPVKEGTKCPSCKGHGGNSSTLSVTPEYTSAMDLELQDLDAHDEIERLTVRMFDKSVSSIAAGEMINVRGQLHVTTRNESVNNRPETILFVESIEHVNKQEISLTEKDIENILSWNQLLADQGKKPVEELAALFAPDN